MASSVVLITGALTGIGRATALAFAREGARVVVSGRNAEDGHALACELHDLGLDAVFVRSDVRYESEISALIDDAVARFGRLDVAVNNAGTEGYPGPIVEQTAAMRSSMLYDLDNGAKTEIDFINGAVVATGRRAAVPTPYNETIVRLVKAREART